MAPPYFFDDPLSGAEFQVNFIASAVALLIAPSQSIS